MLYRSHKVTLTIFYLRSLAYIIRCFIMWWWRARDRDRDRDRDRERFLWDFRFPSSFMILLTSAFVTFLTSTAPPAWERRRWRFALRERLRDRLRDRLLCVGIFFTCTRFFFIDYDVEDVEDDRHHEDDGIFATRVLTRVQIQNSLQTVHFYEIFERMNDDDDGVKSVVVGNQSIDQQSFSSPSSSSSHRSSDD